MQYIKFSPTDFTTAGEAVNMKINAERKSNHHYRRKELVRRKFKFLQVVKSQQTWHQSTIIDELLHKSCIPNNHFHEEQQSNEPSGQATPLIVSTIDHTAAAPSAQSEQPPSSSSPRSIDPSEDVATRRSFLTDLATASAPQQLALYPLLKSSSEYLIMIKR